MNLVKDFSKLAMSDVQIAGGKGASLGEMTRSGFPVPPGYVILSNAFDRFIDETHLRTEIDAVLDTVDVSEVHTIEKASEEIHNLILNKKMPTDIATEIMKSFKKLNCKFVAVRSSATAEDGTSAAWAGQLESYLNTTENKVLENVRKCWASLFSPRAIFYRFEKKLHKERIAVAVVVQKMINSEIAGIAFSVHPVTQDYNQMIIEGGFGLGEAVVSGQITPDSYVVLKNSLAIENKSISSQTRGLFKNKKGGNDWLDISYDKQEQQKISDEQVKELSKIILKIENHYHFPCDIEWAYEKGKFYVVQSRPITTLLKKEEEKDIEVVKVLKKRKLVKSKDKTKKKK